MVRTIKIHVALKLFEERQYAIPVPAFGAHLGPLVVIAGCTAICQLGVDRRAAAHDAALFIVPRRRSSGSIFRAWLQVNLEVRPLEVGIEIGHDGIRIEYILGYPFGRCVLARFEQRNPIGTLRRQPVGKNAASRAAAAYNVVVLHTTIPLPIDHPF